MNENSSPQITESDAEPWSHMVTARLRHTNHASGWGSPREHHHAGGFSSEETERLVEKYGSSTRQLTRGRFFGEKALMSN